MLGQQGGGAGACRQIPGRAVQPERRGETALPDGPAIKGRNTPARLPPRFPAPGKCTSHLGFGLDGGPYPYVWLDGLTQKVREGGRIVNVCVVVATGVNAEGQREILGMDVGTSEDGAFWLAFLRSLTARGLSGVELVTSDAHQGLKPAATSPSPTPSATRHRRRPICWTQRPDQHQRG